MTRSMKEAHKQGKKARVVSWCQPFKPREREKSHSLTSILYHSLNQVYHVALYQQSRVLQLSCSLRFEWLCSSSSHVAQCVRTPECNFSSSELSKSSPASECRSLYPLFMTIYFCIRDNGHRKIANSNLLAEK